MKGTIHVNKRTIPLLLLTSTVLVAAGCGSNTSPSSKGNVDDSSPAATTTTTESVQSTTQADAAATQTLQLHNDGDKLSYDKTTLTAKAGTITIKLTNNGSIPHDIVVEGHESDAGKLISDGKSTETTVTLKPGTYTYYCTPHRSAGMTGKLTVT